MKRLFISCSVMALAVALGVHTSAQESEKPAVAVAQPTEAAKTPSADAKTPKATVAQATKSVRALSVTVEIVGGTRIQGTLVDSSELPMRTLFGQATIPLAEVACIKLASQDNATTTVVMHNGDSITGATNRPSLVAETAWGKADITGSSISSILFAQGLTWTSESGLNGTRWALSEAKKPAAQPTAPVAAQQQPRQLPAQSASNIHPVSGFSVINNGF